MPRGRGRSQADPECKHPRLNLGIDDLIINLQKPFQRGP